MELLLGKTSIATISSVWLAFDAALSLTLIGDGADGLPATDALLAPCPVVAEELGGGAVVPFTSTAITRSFMLLPPSLLSRVWVSEF